MALKEDETIKHLQWIYWRMIDIHNEKEGVDYMIKFNAIIDSIKQEASGSVAAPKEEFDKHKFFDQVSAINAKKDLVIESLQSENTALREALKELLPIAERGHVYLESSKYYLYMDTISRAKALLDKH